MKNYIESRRRGYILHNVKGKKAEWIGHIMRRNCLLNTLLKEGYREI